MVTKFQHYWRVNLHPAFAFIIAKPLWMHKLLPMDLQSRVCGSEVDFHIQLEGQFQGVLVFVLGYLDPKPEYTYYPLYRLLIAAMYNWFKKLHFKFNFQSCNRIIPPYACVTYTLPLYTYVYKTYRLYLWVFSHAPLTWASFPHHRILPFNCTSIYFLPSCKITEYSDLEGTHKARRVQVWMGHGGIKPPASA